MKKSLFLLYILFLSILSLHAQPQFGGGGRPEGARMPAAGRIYGKIIDGSNNSGVEFAVVTLLAGQKDSVITGGLTKSNGEFSLDKIPMGRFRLRVQYVGYGTLVMPVFVSMNNLEQDIGNLTLNADTKTLKEVTISEERPAVTIGVDRRVYNVDKDISTKGGTGVDVMKNIPGLSVDADGNVTLRNNSPTIFVDGRPTTLTIEQIPADQIERVEVITNPSAKYDASALGGIVNVVMKKNTKPGYNGMIGANVGTNNRYGANGNLNIKEKRVNLSLSYNLNHRENPSNGYTYRSNFADGQLISRYNQDNHTDMENTMQFGRIGLDYTLSNRNTLTVAQNIMYGNFNTNDDQHFVQTQGDGSVLYSGNRLADNANRMHNYGTQVLWKHTFPKQGKEWTADLNYNVGQNTNASYFTTYNYDNSGAPLPDNPQLQRNLGSGNTKMTTFQFDFTNPLTDTARIEFGVKVNYRLSNTGLNVAESNALTPIYVTDAFLTSDYRINDNVNAAYVNYTNMFGTIGYQAGLRFEQTYFTGDNQGQHFQYIYPDGFKNLGKALFPSLYLSKKFNPAHELQLNFSRKINRPDWRQIVPFIMFSDKQNYQIGNPSVAPEFTNLAELNYNYIFGFGNWFSSAYMRYQENPITNYVYRSPSDSNILITTFINGQHNVSYGWENIIKFSFIKRKLDLTLSGNVFHTSITANTGGVELENKGFSWNGKAIASYKFPLAFVFQVNGSYEAPRIIPQGKTKEVYSIDLSLNKDLSKRFSLTLTVNDVFNTRRFGTLYETDLFSQDLSRRRETRFVRLSFTWRFGETDVSLFKRKATNNRRDQQNMDQMDY